MKMLLIRGAFIGLSLFMVGQGLFTGCISNRGGVTCWAGEPESFALEMAVFILIGVAGYWAPFRE